MHATAHEISTIVIVKGFFQNPLLDQGPTIGNIDIVFTPQEVPRR